MTATDPAVVAAAIERYRSGATLAEAADAAGVHLVTVWRWLARAGVEVHHRSALRSKHCDDMASLVAGGMSYCAVARAYGVRPSAVSRVCRSRGIKSTARPGRPRKITKVQP